jgi:hypothetical protein
MIMNSEKVRTGKEVVPKFTYRLKRKRKKNNNTEKHQSGLLGTPSRFEEA